MNWAFCANIDLEAKFKHMTSKKAARYEEDQRQTFLNLCDSLETEDIDTCFLVGNLFGKMKPKNFNIQLVVERLTDLAEKGIQFFIVPGLHELPLALKEDNSVLEILEQKGIISVLSAPASGRSTRRSLVKRKGITKPMNRQHRLKIDEPVFEGPINDIPCQIFTLPDPLIYPSNYQYDLTAAIERTPDHLHMVMLPDLFDYRKDIVNNAQITLQKLNEFPLDYVMLGGKIPQEIDPDEYQFELIHCPSVHLNYFPYAATDQTEPVEPIGWKRIEVSTNSPYQLQVETAKIIPISKLKLLRIPLNLEKISPKKWDASIMEKIKTWSSPQTLMQLDLQGTIPKPQYHKLDLFKYQELGAQFNHYFEIKDQLEFADAAETIEDLRRIPELENYVHKEVIPTLKATMGEDFEALRNSPYYSQLQQKTNAEYYQDALEMIKQDYRS